MLIRSAVAAGALALGAVAIPLAASSVAHADTFCNMNVIAVGATSCPFALNVQTAYNSQIGSGAGTVSAYSPATGESYAMSCYNDAPPTHEVTCTGGNGAQVRFNFR